MFNRQSPDAASARTLLDHSTAVAADRSLPDHIRLAALTVSEQAVREMSEDK